MTSKEVILAKSMHYPGVLLWIEEIHEYVSQYS
jgi:hypothetical protein